MNKRLKAPFKQWLKFLGVVLIIILFTVWMSRLWILLLLLPALDIYITRFVNWSWWKEIKNPSIRKIFEWADAIIFALVAVYIINLYLFQNYKIPSSSLEKTLLVGDHLFVSKMAYGPRTPNTPFSFPLVQHTFPVLNCKSYIESIQWKSRRLAGMGEVERNDIVVFNFPAGDTVAVNKQAEDYEGLCYKAGLSRLKSNGNNPDSLRAKRVDVRTLCLTVGRDIIKNDKNQYGNIVYRPVDRRENYVKRCVGLPGDSLQIIERELYINGQKQARPEGVQHFCVITSSKKLDQDFYDEFEISKENWGRGFAGVDQAGDYNYVFPLTLKNQEDMRKLPFIKAVVEHNANDFFVTEALFPVGYNPAWTVDNYGPIYIPKAETTVKIDKNNIALYERIIRNYEGNKLEIRNDDIYINDQKADSYTFHMNYYWMMGDNRHNSADSRMWGFVPQDHVVGKPLFVWLSLNPDKGIFSGGIRWNRFFKYAGQ